MAFTVYRESHPCKFVIVDELADGDVLVCEGIATAEQQAAFLQPEQKKRGRPAKVETDSEAD